MPSTPVAASIGDPSDLSDLLRAFWELQRAVTDAAKPEHHVWHLEFVLAALRRAMHPAVISLEERDNLTRNLIAARDVSLRLLGDSYTAEQIDYGYRAAYDIVARWAVPIDERAARAGSKVSDDVLSMFHFDVVNMRRTASLALKMRGRTLDELLPPLPALDEPDRCHVIPFSRPLHAHKETV